MRLLTAIKLLHTLVWAFFVTCIVALPFTGALHHFRWALLLSALVLVECLALALNHGRCPLTDIAARYTANRSANFDIYLPAWVAKRNKQIFGALFVMAELFVLAQWFLSRA